MLVLVISTLVTVAKKEAIKNAENGKISSTTTGASEDGENSKFNFMEVLYIQYSIAFRKICIGTL